MLDPAKLSFAVPAFNSYKEYDRISVTLNITGNVPPGQTAAFSSPVNFKRENSVAFIEFTTTANSDFHNNTDTYTLLPDSTIFHSNGSTPSFPGTAPYIVGFRNAFTNNSVTVTAAVVNITSSETLTVVNETLAVTLYSVIAPFRS